MVFHRRTSEFFNLIGCKRHTGGGLPLPNPRLPWKISNFEKFLWTKPTFRLYWRAFESRDLPNRDGLQGKPSKISFRSNLLTLFAPPNICIFSLASHFRLWFPRAFHWASFDFNVSCSSCWGYSSINTLELKKNFQVGTRLSTPRDGAIMARPKLAGRQRRHTGHKYLRNKLSHRDVSSCRFFLWRKGLSPLHAVGVINTSGSGRRGWEGVRVHIGPH